MRISGRIIEAGKPPYIVAEISGNHGGDIKNAIELIRLAKQARADAVKTQCYDPDSLTIDIMKPDFIVQNGLWKGKSLHELYRKNCTPPVWHKELYKAARDIGIVIFSSVFDKQGVDFLESLGCPAYKIASFEITDTPLIRHAAKTGKPLIISTGLASAEEVLAADNAAGKHAAFLHCTSQYPADVNKSFLLRMNHLRLMTNNRRPIGVSDHTHGLTIPIAATAMGATIIEKHLRLEGVTSDDSEFSGNFLDFKMMTQAVLEAWEGLQPREPDGAGRQFRRSLYAVKDIKAGEVYTEDNIRSIRPGYGLPPSMLPKLLGKKAKQDWKRGDPLS